MAMTTIITDLQGYNVGQKVKADFKQVEQQNDDGNGSGSRNDNDRDNNDYILLLLNYTAMPL